MKRLLPLALAASLCACAALPIAGIPTSPAAVANTTTLDEKALAGVELAYKAANKAATIAVTSGLVPAGLKPRLRDADSKAFAAVEKARLGYASANADTYDAAIDAALAAVKALDTLIPSKESG